jgi:hypothetical protein
MRLVARGDLKLPFIEEIAVEMYPIAGAVAPARGVRSGRDGAGARRLQR